MTADTRSRLWEWSVVVAVVSLYLFLALLRWESPGFICDWLYSEQAALDIIARLEKGMSPLAVFLEGNSRVDAYHGTLIGTLLAPLFMIFGHGWFLARLYPIAFGALTLVLTYRFCREFFGRAAAFLAIFLLSIHAPYILETKLGSWFENHTQSFTVGSLLLLALWRSRKKWRYFVAGMTVIGLGFGTRVWWIWFPSALLAYGLLYSLRFLQRHDATIDWGRAMKACLIGGLAFWAGHWLGSRDMTPHAWNDYLGTAVAELFSPSNRNGIFHYGETLQRTIQQFNSMLSGNAFVNALSADGYPFFNPWAVLIFWTVLILATATLFRQNESGRERWMFVVFLFLAMFCISPLNAGWHSGIHLEPLIFLYPFPQILEAAGFVSLWSHHKSRVWRSALLLGLGILIASEVRSITTADAYLRETGGRRNYSRSIYDLADWAKDQRAAEANFLVFYHNLSHHLFLLTSDPYFRLVFSYDNTGQTGDKCWIVQNGEPTWFSNTAALVLSRINGEVFVIDSLFTLMPGKFGAFKEMAVGQGFSLSLEKQFKDDDGVAVFNVHRMKKV